jgi:tetratricopeptide (TPR) repeat protein
MSRTASKTRSRTVAAPGPQPRPAAARNWTWPWLLLAACALAFLAYGPALNGTFVFDDYHLPFADPNAAQMPAKFWIGGVRPVLIATYWANFLLAGTSPPLYHLTNLVLHSVTAVLVFFLLRRLFELSSSGLNKSHALFGAALFLLHPLQTESVAYIAGRSEIVAGLFFIAAWLVFLNRFDSETRFTTALTVLLLAGAAVLGKESAISLPAVLLATDWYWRKQPFIPQLRQRAKLYLPFLLGAVAGSILILRSLTSGTAAGFSNGVSPLAYALTECRVIPIYIRMFLIPAGQNGDWHLAFFHSLTSGGAFLYLLAMLALIGAIVWLYNRDRLVSFGLAIFLLTLAPTSSVVPIKEALAERRMYLPITGLIVVSLALANRFRLSSRVLQTAAAASLLLAAALTWQRSSVWASDLAFWMDSTQKDPASSRAHFGYGSALVSRNDCAAAVREFEAARTLDPSANNVQWNLAEAHQCNNHPEAALTIFRSIAAAHPSADAWNRIGFLEATLGHTDEAMTAINHAMELDPNNATAWAYRGIARIALNDAAGAASDLHHALALQPDNQPAITGLTRLADLKH